MRKSAKAKRSSVDRKRFLLYLTVEDSPHRDDIKIPAYVSAWLQGDNVTRNNALGRNLLEISVAGYRNRGPNDAFERTNCVLRFAFVKNPIAAIIARTLPIAMASVIAPVTIEMPGAAISNAVVSERPRISAR